MVILSTYSSLLVESGVDLAFGKKRLLLARVLVEGFEELLELALVPDLQAGVLVSTQVTVEGLDLLGQSLRDANTVAMVPFIALVTGA